MPNTYLQWRKRCIRVGPCAINHEFQLLCFIMSVIIQIGCHFFLKYRQMDELVNWMKVFLEKKPPQLAASVQKIDENSFYPRFSPTDSEDCKFSKQLELIKFRRIHICWY